MQNLQENKQYLLSNRLTSDQINFLNGIKNKVSQFSQRHSDKSIVLLTSGGTSVPLQKKAVRFIQNFSTGLRGSLLAQQILSEGLPLIFFYRDKSLLPFQKGITISSALLSESQQSLNELLQARKQYLKYKDQILLLPFSTIYTYLNGILQIKKSLPLHSIIILCAAVSDFIPKQLPQHKITTSEQLSLSLMNVPKILKQMTSAQNLCVSFKLETDSTKMSERIYFALNKYEVDLVVGNLLGNKNWVRIQFNQKRFAGENGMKKEYVQYTTEIQKNIMQEIKKVHKILYQKNV